MAAILEERLEVSVSLVVGNRGEFSVWVGDQCVAQKDLNGFPHEDDVVRAVDAALP